MMKVIFSGAFRPLFLLVGLSAPVAVAVWLLYYLGYWQLFEVGQSPLNWHAHEMLFGVVGAAVGGFLFTAVANWTGRAPLQGSVLALLVVLWLAGRVVMWPGFALHPVVVAVVDLSYLTLVTLLLWRELYLGGNRRNYVLLAVIALLLVANLLFHLAVIAFPAIDQWGIRAGTLLVLLLLTIIGGRIIPAFTRNWLMLNRIPAKPPAEFGRLDGAAVAATVLLIPCWAVWPSQAATGLLLLLAASLHALRLARWRGQYTLREPLVLVLHVAYAWIPVGYLLLGGSILAGYPVTGGVHALTIGAMMTMIMAVSSRAAMGHSGRPLHATPLLTLAYVLITIAAILRVSAALAGATRLMMLTGIVWLCAFGAFVCAVGPILVQPRVEPQQ